MSTQKYNKSTRKNRIRPTRFFTLGLAVVFLLLTPGLGRAADASWDANGLNRAKITFDNSDQSEDLVNRRGNANVDQNINHPDQFQTGFHSMPTNYRDGEAFKPCLLYTSPSPRD